MFWQGLHLVKYASKGIWISLVIWATELDTSLSSSICQPASICRYRARGLSLFRGDKVKMHRARWLIELGFSREEKREKMEIKAIITTWSTKSKTPSSSQFVTDKKTLCSWSINVVLVFKKIIDKKTFFFTLSSLIYLTRDYRPSWSTARELNDLVLQRRPLTSLIFHARIVFIWKKFKSLVFPLESFDLIGTQSAIHCIKYTYNIHFLSPFYL